MFAKGKMPKLPVDEVPDIPLDWPETRENMHALYRVRIKYESHSMFIANIIGYKNAVEKAQWAHEHFGGRPVVDYVAELV